MNPLLLLVDKIDNEEDETEENEEDGRVKSNQDNDTKADEDEKIVGGNGATVII